jgi:hypothetical protein
MLTGQISQPGVGVWLMIAETLSSNSSNVDINIYLSDEPELRVMIEGILDH